LEEAIAQAKRETRHDAKRRADWFHDQDVGLFGLESRRHLRLASFWCDFKFVNPATK
jgi:tRNA A37 N6-isopentenylltransferase MiaA